jgi:hypothetical protein
MEAGTPFKTLLIVQTRADREWLYLSLQRVSKHSLMYTPYKSSALERAQYCEYGELDWDDHLEGYIASFRTA